MQHSAEEPLAAIDGQESLGSPEGRAEEHAETNRVQPLRGIAGGSEGGLHDIPREPRNNDR